MPSQLPNRLSYLSGVVAELEKFEPDSLGDDNPAAQDLVEAAVRSRMRGMEGEEAKATIERDCSDLQQWLEQPGFESSPGFPVHPAEARAFCQAVKTRLSDEFVSAFVDGQYLQLKEVLVAKPVRLPLHRLDLVVRPLHGTRRDLHIVVGQ
jgi:hypothetical protein